MAEEKGNKTKELPSKGIDISGVFLIIKHKLIFFVITILLIFTFLTDKTLKQTMIFSTQGILYVEEEGKFLDFKDKVLKKILPNYDDKSRREIMAEYFKNPVVIENAIIRSGYNVFVSEKRDAKYTPINFMAWNSKYKKNIKYLIPSNEENDLYIDNAKVLDTYLKDVQLAIKFVDYNEFKIFSKKNSRYISTHKVGEPITIKNLCTFTIHRKELKDDKKFFDPISPLVVLPEPLYITITNQDLLFRKLKNNINIIMKRGSSMIKTNTDGDNPFLIQKFNDELVQAFMDFNIQSKIKIISKVNDFMEEERTELATKRKALTKRLQEIRESSRIVTEGAHFSIISKNKEGAGAKLKDTINEIKRLKIFEKHLKTTHDIEKIHPLNIGGQTILADINAKFFKDIQEFQEISLEYTKNSKLYKNALAKVNQQKELLVLEVENKLHELQLIKQSIEDELESATDKLILSIKVQDEIAFLKKKMQLIDDNNEELYIRARNLLYNKVFIKYSNRVLKEALLPKTPKNKISGQIITNVIVSIILATIITILKHVMFPLFLSRVVISTSTTSDILGGIPKIPKKSVSPEGLIDFEKEDKIFELLTTLQTLVFFNHPEIKTIQFTSPYPKDGKTFLARNIAQSLAMNNAKVILINMDLDFQKKQKLKKIDSAADLKKSIKKIQLKNKKYIYILPFNTTEQNMQIDAKLEKYKKILASLKNSFDYIILDTPQYPMYTESLSLSTIVDLSISVVKLNHTPVKVSGKHFKDISKFSNRHIVLVNNDLININSSGYAFIEKANIQHHIERLKLKLSQI